MYLRPVNNPDGHELYLELHRATAALSGPMIQTVTASLTKTLLRILTATE
ncbi:MAG: hypothetical protein U5L72_00760 [Bacteroidales bacterium]|nr:hypothetical protein [Bacteroidales bacterium]